MTERIYYTDPYATEFDATVVAIAPVPDYAARHHVVLDRTAFYPTSGGQPIPARSARHVSSRSSTETTAASCTWWMGR